MVTSFSVNYNFKSNKIIERLIQYILSTGTVIFLFVYVSFVHAQNNNEITFRNVSGELSESSITKIIEDKQGFLWVGTTNGVVKYNGSTFEKFDKFFDKNLTNNFVKELYLDDAGVLYVGTFKGLSYYDKELNTLKRYPFLGKTDVLDSLDISSLLKEGDYLWIGSSRKGMFKYNIKTGAIKNFFFDVKDVDLNNIVHISKYKAGHYVVVSRKKAYIIDENMSIKSSVKVDDIKAVDKAANNNFLLGSFSGEYSELVIRSNLKLEERNKRKVTDYTIASLEEDAEGNVWIASENDGLFIYDKSKGKIKSLKNSFDNPHLLPNNSIWYIYKASNGVMWLGSFKKGISFYDKYYHKFRHEKTKMPVSRSLSNNIITCLLEDEKNNLWIGTDGGGLNYWDRNHNMYKRYSLNDGTLTANAILSLVKSDDKLWVGTWGEGIAVFDVETKEFVSLNKNNSTLTSNHIQNLFKDSSGDIWVGTFRGGVLRYDKKTKTFKGIDLYLNDLKLEPYQIMAILEDNSGNIWLGTHGDGVIRLEKKGGAWKVAQQYRKLSSNKKNIDNDFVNVIYKDKDGLIWVGTDSGLSRYNFSQDLLEVVNNKLTNLSVESMRLDQHNNLWLATNKGLKKYNVKNNSVVTFGTSDGVQGKDFNSSASYETTANELIFGGSNGFNIFFPEEIRKRKNIPNLYVSKLKIQNKEVYPNDEFGVLKKDISMVDSIAVDYMHNVINFEFTTITFRNQKNIEYAYFLEGFDQKWNNVGNKNDVTYTNLDPGEYKLHVKSTNSDGVWVNNDKTLFLKIVPPFWQTLWFKLLLVSILLVGIGLLYFSRIKIIKIKQRKLKQEIAERTKELQLQKDKLIQVADQLSLKNEEIQRFAFSVSHDLKSPLSNINTISGLIQMEFLEKDYPLIDKYLEMINVSCEAMDNLITDITRVARLGKIKNKKEILDTNQIVKLSKAMISTRFEEYNVELVVKEALPNIYADRNRIIQVFSNLFDNSIKYRGDQKNPVIEISCKETEKMIIMSISDNGSGIEAKYLDKLFSPFERFHPGVKGTGLGLYMIKQIVNSHGGDISASSQGKGKGSTFTVSLPK